MEKDRGLVNHRYGCFY